MSTYYSIGLMSGTSLDGLDIALCQFSLNKGNWNFKLLKAATYPYSRDWADKLSIAHKLDLIRFLRLHKEYGSYLGNQVNMFLEGLPVDVDLIASHGHTVFHMPEKQLTFQLGDGGCLAAQTGITTVSDFRSLDIAYGGQGAPLVPMGDELLFDNYGYCLNLGGFANISYNENGKRIACDICAVNYAINYLALMLGKKFDKDGLLASKGQINEELLDLLNSLDYYFKPPPKSIGREWFEKNILPILKIPEISTIDILRTYCEHIAIQIANATRSDRLKSVLTTGGGAYNKFLISLLDKYSINQFVIPDNNIIEFKEAVIFAFLGTLRLRNEINVLSSATGAIQDNCGGIIHLTKKS